ncbi:MAG: cell division protein FtsA, partial [Flavobacteriales bacterium]
MEQGEIAIGLDIGTTKIVTIVGRKNEFDKIEILGFGKAKSLGVQRGVVSNITQTIDSIKHAIADAEADSGATIDNCVVGIAGQHIRSLQHSDYILRENAQEVITQADVDLLVQNVHKLVMLPGEEIIHVLPQEFKIDGEPNISEPIGMLGRRLEANLHIVVGQKAAIGNIFSCVKNSNLKVSGITLEPLASAEAVLSDEEREAGVCL